MKTAGNAVTEIVPNGQQMMAAIIGITEGFNAILDSDVQGGAFGAPSEPGDMDRIVHIAERFISVYGDFMDWAAGLRGVSVAESGGEALKALARWAEQPVEECRSFVTKFVDEMDEATARIEAGEEFQIGIHPRLG